MKITGYALREAIKQQELKRDTAAASFRGSQTKFPDEEKPTPHQVMTAFATAEGALVALQEAQMKYNLAVTCEVFGEKTTLATAIKTVGAAGRVEKMWKSAVPADNYYESEVRSPDQIRAVRTLKAEEVLSLSIKAGKKAGALRAAIAIANAREVEIENLDRSLFE